MNEIKKYLIKEEDKRLKNFSFQFYFLIRLDSIKDYEEILMMK